MLDNILHCKRLHSVGGYTEQFKQLCKLNRGVAIWKQYV